MKMIAAALGGALLVVASLYAVPAGAQQQPLFETGQPYMFVWDCMPEWQAMLAAQALQQSLNPCYVEVLEVTVIRPDGWLVVTDIQGSQWTVNPSRAISIKKYEPKAAAPQPADQKPTQL